MISVTINGEGREVPAEVDLDRLLELFSLPKQRVAIELNNQVVRRADYDLKIPRVAHVAEVADEVRLEFDLIFESTNE